MDRVQAQRLLATVSKIHLAFELLNQAIETMDDSSEQKTLRRMAAPMLVSSYDLVEYIAEQHPDLEPLGSE